MRLVKQLDLSGCTVACVAMIANESYFGMREIIHKNVPRIRNIKLITSDTYNVGLYSHEIKELLQVMLKKPCKFVKFLSLEQITKHCILFIMDLEWNNSHSHCIVFDAKNKRILDPCNRIENLDKHNVACCLEID